MHIFSTAAVFVIWLLVAAPVAAQPEPPYAGTIFLDPDIVLPSDPTIYVSATYTGQGPRLVFDRRVNGWVTVQAYLFELAFNDGSTIEAQINPEFGSEQAARAEAEYYGPPVGQLPAVLRKDVDALWIHKGTEPFGGGNRSLLIHTGQSEQYVAAGILEEVLIHEAAHTSLDADHAASSGWLAAQTADGTFISTYAQDYPMREDIAESFLPYLAVRYRSDRISQEMWDTITGTIPHRIAYFDAQGFDMSPVSSGGVATEGEAGTTGVSLTVAPNPVRGQATIRLSLDRPGSVRIEVIDLLGRVVAVVGAGELSPGDSAHSWDTRALPAGLYICRVVVDGESVIRRVTVVR